MSAANASARKRRAPPPTIVSPASSGFSPSQTLSPTQPQGPGSSSGLTLPQVILLVDKRLTVLEKFMKTTNEFMDSQQNTPLLAPLASFTPILAPLKEEPEPSVELDGIVEEFNVRYSMLAEEIANLKDMMLKLSAYTMDVNKKLFEQHPANQPESKPLVQPESKPLVQPETKPLVQPETKPLVQPETKPQVQLETKPLVQSETKPLVQPETKPLVQPETKPLVQPETKPLVQPETKPLVQPETKPLVQPETKPLVQPETKPLVQLKIQKDDFKNITSQI
jgi:hypothetical protein